MKQQLRVFALTKRSSRVSNWLVGVVMCFLYLTKPTVVFSSTFSRAFSPTFYPTLIADEVAALIYLFPIIKLGFQDSNPPLAESFIEQQTKQVKQIINLLLPPVIKPHKYSPTLSFSDHTSSQQAGARHFYQRIHVYPLTVSGSSPFATPEPDDCTATEASENIQYQREGEQRTFSSFGALLTIPDLWSRFTEYLPLYDSHAELPNDEADAKCVVLNDLDLRGFFLLINDIQQIPLTAARGQAESRGSRTVAASAEVGERQADAASRVRNIAMDNQDTRLFSLASLSGLACRSCLHRDHPALNNAVDLCTEGFYYSYAHRQLECFSCGGVLDPERVCHCSSLRELHGKFYPNCRFLLQLAGEEYVSHCQQNLTDEERALVPQPLPDDPGLYSEPVSGDDIARDQVGAQSDIDQIDLQEGRVPGISGAEYLKLTSQAERQMHTESGRRPDHCSGLRPGTDCAAPAQFRNTASSDTPARAGNAGACDHSTSLRLHQLSPENVQTLRALLFTLLASTENGLDSIRPFLQRGLPDSSQLRTLQERVMNPQHDQDTGRNPGHSSGQRPCAGSAAPVRSGNVINNDTPASSAASFNSDIRHLQRALSPESFLALRTLRERIEDPEHDHQRNRLRQNFLEITNHLNSLPAELCRLVGAEIAAMIAAIIQGDCQDHTSEVLDQIHTRVTFAVLRHELQARQAAGQPVELFDVFDRLKIFFNESVLYQLLGEFEGNGEPLAQCGESTEIRSYLKNRFSGICRFSRHNILQAFTAYIWLDDELLEELELTFVERISGPAGFVHYLTGLFSTDTVFLDYIKQSDEHFAEQYNDIITAAYSDLEQYTSGNPELSEQEVLEGAARVSADRTARIARLIENYTETQVQLFWNRILENERLKNRQNRK